MTARDAASVSLPTSMAVNTTRPHTAGNRAALGELVVSLEYTGVDPIVVPAGASGLLLQMSVGLGANPPTFVTTGGATAVPQVLHFASAQGVQLVTVDLSFNPQANEGAVAWVFAAEVGVGLDSITPPPILGSFATPGFSNNSAPTALMVRTFNAPTFLGLDAQVRVTHDKVTDISIENLAGFVSTVTAAAAEIQRV